MLTIALDEQGDFEGVKPQHEPIFVAGVVYDDCDDSADERNERARIEKYYRKLIADVSNDSPEFAYPASLHSNGNRRRDREVIAPVKQKVKETISEFLLNGTYERQELLPTKRTGKYKIFIVFKSEKGMEKLLGPNLNILSRDDYASNLYYHMVSLLMKKLLFHNPDYDIIRNVKLNIATRSTGSLSRNEELARQYKKLGYRAQDDSSQPDKVYFSLTNADTYRSVLAEEIIRTGKSRIKFEEFKVMSINYHREHNMEFLYLADSICSILGFKVPQSTGSDLESEWFREFIQRADDMVSKQNVMTWVYDSIDTIFSEAWEKLEAGDYYEALKRIYRLQEYDTVYSEYYFDRWCSLLKGRIIKNVNITDMSIAVQKLSQSVRTNDLNQGELVFITDALEEAAGSLGNDLERVDGKKMLYSLYDTGVSAYTHIGNSKKAEEYYEKCKKYMTVVGLDSFLATQNKVCVYYNDYFKFQDTKKLASENVAYYELLKELQESLPFKEAADAGKIGYGKAVSQYAQTLAFCRDSAAETEFRKALEQFPEGSSDYKQTQSYLLHFYLDMGMETEYLAESASYFGGKTSLSNQLKYIIKEGTKRGALINLKYAYYVWIRGIYLFRKSETAGIWNKILQFETMVAKELGLDNWRLSNHPAEVIFKYLVLLAAEVGDEENVVNFKEKIGNSSRYNGVTVDAIILYGYAELAYILNDDKTLRDNVSRLVVLLKQEFDRFEDYSFSDDTDEAYKELSIFFSFMYH